MKARHISLFFGMAVVVFLLTSCTRKVEVVKEVEVTKVVEVEKPQTNRLDTVRERGKLICASRNDVPGYGSLDASGNNVGFDIDLCRAVATAVLGDPGAI